MEEGQEILKALEDIKASLDKINESIRYLAQFLEGIALMLSKDSD